MLMSLQQKYAKILSEILPAGLVGASLLLGSVVPSSANQRPQSAQPLASDEDAVAQRLAAVRAAVSAAGDPAGTAAKPGHGNLRWPNWNNWRNWNNWNNWWRNW
jgi:outer membrane murein-binding lipoprotein Lpp